MTVTSHTSCKAVMFLPKAGVYIALIICAVNSYFVWGFCFYRILIFNLATPPKCCAYSIRADIASVGHRYSKHMQFIKRVQLVKLLLLMVSK